MKKFGLEFLASFFYLFFGCLLEILILKFFPWNIFLLEIFLISIIFAFTFGVIYFISNL